jgi:hypothetical protein
VSFSSSSSTCSIYPRSSILTSGELVIVTIGSAPLPHCTHAVARKLLQHLQPPSVVMLRCDDERPHPVRLCSSSWTAQHAPQLEAIEPMSFPHVLEGLSAAVATHCQADAVPCCVLSCPSAALSSVASSIVGASVSFAAAGLRKQSNAPPLYI